MNDAYEFQWREADERIDASIEKHRKSNLLLTVEDDAGRPIPGAAVRVRQTASSFLFGANLFMLGGYPTAEQNARYEQAYLGLYNAGTVPFYWRDLEPVPGELRFVAQSRRIARRPPPDAVVAFCKRHALNMNGHPLVWDFVKWSAPDWLPDDPAASWPMWENRIRQIADRYGNDIGRWDVVNEAIVSGERVAKGQSRRMPDDYVQRAFAAAKQHLPHGAVLMINDITPAWDHMLDAYVGLIGQLLDAGTPIGGVGMQFHLFSDRETSEFASGGRFGPETLWRAMDRLGQFGLPIHISEITLPALANDASGQALQARVARDLYRLWFSHPSVHAITWWNLPDGGAAPGEDKLASGLLNADLSPKPAYHALQDLIRRDWRTDADLTTGADGAASVRAFHGEHEITVRAAGRQQTQRVHVTPGASADISIRL